MHPNTNKFITDIEPKQVPASADNMRLGKRTADQTANTAWPPTPTTPVDLSWGSSSNILNLSTLFQPTPDQIKLLEMGLTFIPTPSAFDEEELRRDLHQYHRRIKILHHFAKPNQNIVSFTFPSSWEPTWEQLDTDVKNLICADLPGRRILRPLSSDGKWRSGQTSH